MLNSLYIKKFRLFKELKIERLRRVNLFVGKNNSGKTCLLEALHLYAKNASPDSLYQLISERGENWKREGVLDEHCGSIPEMSNPLRYLFYNYQFPEVGKPGIEMGSLKSIEKSLKLGIGAYHHDGQRLIRIDESQLSNNPLTHVELVIEKGDEAIPLLRLNGESLFSPPILNKAKLNVQLISTKPLNRQTLARLWDNINVQLSSRKEVFKGLQLIDERIEEVVLVGYLDEPNQVDNIMPVLIYHDSEEKRLITNLGEGISRVFYIILALVNARDGFLLIDEFENGLHWKVQAKLWEMIFNLAKKLDVQIFATTHSQDCVQSFYAVWETQENQGSFHRLHNRSGFGTVATPYRCETLANALEMDVEMR
ncbi:MAG: AAA family ATPase [Pseudomonadota bacterium]